MNSVSVTIYGRIKPCAKQYRSSQFQLKFNKNEDYIIFTSQKNPYTRTMYRFQKIFDEFSTQEEIFEEVAKPIIQNVLKGYNGTIFTYGQTGTGKTYTMTGDLRNWKNIGIIPRTINEIFRVKTADTVVSLSYYEIYNEHVYDLLKPDNELQVVILEDAYGSTHIRNLSVHEVTTVDDALKLLIVGDENKAVAQTSGNARSSRSHVIFSISLDLPHNPENNAIIRPVIYLVDLAGSEKSSKSSAGVSNPVETRYINLSLHYLEQVLIALKQPGRNHIPYRNSVMTAILRNSLGGNSITALIATFSVTANDLSETIQTCRFAERTSQVKNEVKITEKVDLQKEIEFLRKENEFLKSQLRIRTSSVTPYQTLSQQQPSRSLLQQSRSSIQQPTPPPIRSPLPPTLQSTQSSLQQPFSAQSQQRFSLQRQPSQTPIVRMSALPPEDFVNSNRELTPEEKEECTNMVNNYIKDSNYELPTDDIAKMKYCLHVMRGEIMKKPDDTKLEGIATNGYHSFPLNTSCTSKSSVQVKAFGSADKVLRNRKNSLELPKVNITYKRWRSSDQLSDRENVTRRKINSREFSPTKKISEASTSSNSSIETKGFYNRDRSRSSLSFTHRSQLVKNYLKTLPEIPFEKLEDEKENETLIGINKPSKKNFYPDSELIQNKRSPLGERCSQKNLKKSIHFPGFGFTPRKPSDQTAASKKNANDDSMSVKSNMSIFSTSQLPLTGDPEVDEEIVKFYQARYVFFKNKNR